MYECFECSKMFDTPALTDEGADEFQEMGVNIVVLEVCPHCGSSLITEIEGDTE
jgi:DNA-directed RNA polymerase subunit RPC12/RpoP